MSNSTLGDNGDQTGPYFIYQVRLNFTMSIFAKPLMELNHVWHDDRYVSKMLRSIILTPAGDIKVKVTHLEF